MDGNEVIQHVRQARYTTLALADQIKDDRWNEPLLPGERTIQDLLSHVIAWDEWLIAVLDISRVRELPPGLVHALGDVDAYNAKAVARFHNLTRDVILGSLQGASDRLLKSVFATGPDWERRELPPLVLLTGETGQLSLRRALRYLAQHEVSHHSEIELAYDVHLPERDTNASDN